MRYRTGRPATGGTIRVHQGVLVICGYVIRAICGYMLAKRRPGYKAVGTC